MSEQLRIDPNTACKEEVQKIKANLPKNIRDRICEKFPEYNTKIGSKLMDNVLAGRSADLRLTEILKQFAFANKTSTQTTISDGN